MTIWVLSIICIGSAWCIPEHNHVYRDMFATKDLCLEDGKKRVPEPTTTENEIWVFNCAEWIVK